MSHIGETYGIYKIIGMLSDKDKYGHWIYKCECVKCGHIRFSHYGSIAGPKSVIRCCNHLRAKRSNPFKFEEWALSNGYADHLTIDRIDSSKDYCPENCRWVTLQNNAKYKSTTGVLTVDNVSRTGRDWANECGLGCNTINTMLREYRTEDVITFIRERLKNPNKTRGAYQIWFDVYGIVVSENQA